MFQYFVSRGAVADWSEPVRFDVVPPEDPTGTSEPPGRWSLVTRGFGRFVLSERPPLSLVPVPEWSTYFRFDVVGVSVGYDAVGKDTAISLQ